MTSERCPSTKARCSCSVAGEHDDHACECGGVWVDDGTVIALPEVDPAVLIYAIASGAVPVRAPRGGIRYPKATSEEATT